MAQVKAGDFKFEDFGNDIFEEGEAHPITKLSNKRRRVR